MNPPSRTGRARFALWAALFSFTLTSLFAAEAVKAFNVPAGDAATTLKQAAQQGGVEIVFPATTVRGVQTAAVKGDFTAREALNRMLAGTELVLVQDEKSGALSINRLSAKPKNELSPSESGGAKIEEGRVVIDPYRVTEIRPTAFGNASTDLWRGKDDPLTFVTFDARDIQSSGAASVEDFLIKRLSQNTSVPNSREESDPLFGDGVGSTTNGNGSANGSAINFRGWSSLLTNNDPGSDTVILVNGRRVPPRSTGRTSGLIQGSLNIPLALIERIEVMPSAGGAIYGAGATSGVINIITRKQVRGGEASIRYENYQLANAPRYDASFSYSVPIGDRTSVRVNAGWSRAEPMSEESGQAYWLEQFNRIAAYQPTLITTATTPPRAALPNITSTSSTAPLFGAGTPTSTSTPAGYTGTGGLTPFSSRQGVLNTTLPDLRTRGATTESFNLGLAVERQLNDRWELSVDYGYYQSDSNSSPDLNPAGSSGLSGGTFLVPTAAPSNPFGRDVRVSAADPMLTALTPATTGLQRRHSLGASLRGDLWQGWRGLLDYSYSTSDTFRDTGFTPEPIGGWNAALLAGRYNPFVDPYAIRPAAAGLFDAYELRRQKAFTRINTSQYTARLSGPIWTLPAGDIRFTVGGDFQRVERPRSYTNDLTVNSATGAFIRAGSGADNQSEAVQAQQDDRIFTNDSWGGYAEASVPLASQQKHFPLVRALDLQVSGRIDQSRSQDARITVTSDPSSLFAVGVRWEPLAGLAFRANRTNGEKLPRYSQLVPSISTSATTITDPKRNESYQIFNTISGGNPDLQRESNTSTNLGVILQPKWKWFETMRLSAELAESERHNAIVSITNNNLLLREDEPIFAGRVVRAATVNGVVGRVTSLNRSFYNARYIRSRDLDLTLEKTFKNVLHGRIIVAVSATKRLKFEQQATETTPLIDVIENVNPAAGGFPPPVRWNGNGWIRWEGRAWSLGWSARYYDDLLIRVDGTIGARNLALNAGRDRADKAFTHDAFIEYRFARAAKGDTGWRSLLSETGVTLGVNNVLDRDARYYPSGALGAFGIAPGDSTYGRMFWLRVNRPL